MIGCIEWVTSVRFEWGWFVYQQSVLLSRVLDVFDKRASFWLMSNNKLQVILTVVALIRLVGADLMMRPLISLMTWKNVPHYKSPSRLWLHRKLQRLKVHPQYYVHDVSSNWVSKCNDVRTPVTVGVAAKPAAQKKTKGSNKTKSSIKKQQDQGGVGEPCEAPIANLPEPPSSLPGPEGLVW